MASTITYSQCPACGSAAIGHALQVKDFTVSKKLFEVWKCSHCTLLFTQNIPDRKAIAAYYQSSEYVSHSDTKKGLINNLYHTVRNFTLTQKRGLVQKATGMQQGSLLDVGAGTGAFAHTMLRAGWTVTGHEPDTNARQTATDKYGIQLKPLEEMSGLPAESFDVITLWHVLEHVHDLHSYLNTFMQLLKPAGKLIIAVPNHKSYDATVYGVNWAAYDVPRHLYHFSPKSMEQLLMQKSFIVEQCKPMWFDSFYVSMLSEKYKSGKTNLVKAFWYGALSNLKAIGHTEKCSSVIYFACKQ